MCTKAGIVMMDMEVKGASNIVVCIDYDQEHWTVYACGEDWDHNKDAIKNLFVMDYANEAWFA